MHHRSCTIALLLLGTLVAGCEPVNGPVVSLDPPRQNIPAAASTSPTTLFVEPDFSLADANPNSATHAQNVSPRACIGKISAWYFGHAT